MRELLVGAGESFCGWFDFGAGFAIGQADEIQAFELRLENVALAGELVDLDIDVDVLQLSQQLAFGDLVARSDERLFEDSVDRHT